MSPTRSAARQEEDAPPRLGYLLKVAHLRFVELTTAALAPLGIDSREWGALISVDDEHPMSQAELAERVGIDRTTMVAVVDGLQRKKLVRRAPHRDDRRKNVVELTATGRDVRRRAARQVDECERRFLAALSQPDARRLKKALRTLTTQP